MGKVRIKKEDTVIVISGKDRDLTKPRRVLQVMPSADGYFVISVGNDSTFDRFCEATGAKELLDDPRFATAVERVRNRDLVTERLHFLEEGGIEVVDSACACHLACSWPPRNGRFAPATDGAGARLQSASMRLATGPRMGSDRAGPSVPRAGNRHT